MPKQLLVAVVAPPIRLLVVKLAVESVLLVMWVGVKTIVGGPEGIRLTQMCVLRGQKRLSVVPKASDQPGRRKRSVSGSESVVLS